MTPIKTNPVSKVENLTPIAKTFKTSAITQSSISSSSNSSCCLIQRIKDFIHAVIRYFKELCYSTTEEEEKPFGLLEINLMFDAVISPEQFAQLLKQNPYVEKLTVAARSLKAKDLTGIANLKKLKEFRFVTDGSFSPYLHCLAALPIERLMTDVSKADFHHLQPLGNTLKVLTLNLNGCDDHFFQQENNPFSCFPNLESLNLVNCRLYEDQSYITIAQTVREFMPRIAKIHIDARYGFQGQSLDTFAKIPSLKELKIINAKNIVGQWAADFRRDRPDVDLIFQFS